MDFAAADRRVPATISYLKESFGFKGYGATDLDHAIQLFATYMSRGKLHALEKRYSEAFLHHVIALELIFAARHSIDDSVSRRVAVLVHQKLKSPPQTTAKLITALYDRRSRYVHQGEDVGEESVGEVELICREVLACLMRLRQRNSNSSTSDFLSEWLKMLDFFWSAFQAGQPIDRQELTSFGIE